MKNNLNVESAGSRFDVDRATMIRIVALTKASPLRAVASIAATHSGGAAFYDRVGVAKRMVFDEIGAEKGRERPIADRLVTVWGVSPRRDSRCSRHAIRFALKAISSYYLPTVNLRNQ
ncbi:MAG: hypothetical protein AAFN79_10395 [Pseudomonadota bacterium]